MAGGNKISWSDGEVLCSRHLETFGSDMQSYSWHLYNSLSINNYGILDIQLAQKVLTSQQKLYIQSVKCIFPDGTYVDYQNEYELSFNFKNFSFNDNDQLYLSLSGEEFKYREEYKQFNTLKKINKTGPKLYIATQYHKNSISFVKLNQSITGNIQIRYYGNFINIQEDITNQLTTLQDDFLAKQSIIKSELDKPNLLTEQKHELQNRLRTNNDILMYLILCKQHKSTYDLYKDLLNILCKLLSLNNNILSDEYKYNYSQDSLSVIDKILDHIQLINNQNTVFAKIYGELQNQQLVFKISSDLQKISSIILWVQQQHDDQIKQWLLNTNIASKIYYDQIYQDRKIGIIRNLQQYATCYAVKLHLPHEYFTDKEDLIVRLPDNMQQYHKQIYITIQ